MGEIWVRHRAGEEFAISVRGHTLPSGQPPDGAEAGPTPLELFVASLATCQALAAAHFLSRHGLKDGELELVVTFDINEGPPTRLGWIRSELRLPRTLPDQIETAVVRAMDHCTVSNALRYPPRVELLVADTGALTSELIER
jgi:putative redox protein